MMSLPPLLLVILMLVSGQAASEWVMLGGNESITLYVDPAMVRRSRSMVKIWTLVEFGSLQVSEGKFFMSEKQQAEYDCTGYRRRLLAFVGYSESQGDGDLVYSDATTREWEPIVPDSVDEFLWKLACGEK